eukprot:4375686-Amphidinium_carterae.1
MERPAKAAELVELRGRLPHLSQSALAAVLHKAKQSILPHGKRKKLRQSRDQYCHLLTPYGSLHRTVDIKLKAGGHESLEVQDPFAVLHYLAQHSHTFAHMVQTCMVKKPCTVTTPWHVIIYSDE